MGVEEVGKWNQDDSLEKSLLLVEEEGCCCSGEEAWAWCV
jgi:hypothetical protein